MIAPSRPRILMCPPTHFSVDYDINPWMTGNRDRIDQARARQQWEDLHRHVSSAAHVELIDHIAGLPDMVFTANAGLVYRDTAVPSRFRHEERAGEEAYFTRWFNGNAFAVDELEGISFEGAGDALLDRGQPLLWVGYGHRSDGHAAVALQKLLGVETVALQLVDPRFYHLDTCLCPLSGGHLMYYPAAFDAASQAAIAARVPEDKRIAVSEEDALAFACNAVNLDDMVILNRASEALRQRLGDAGYRVQQTPLDEFLKAGGSAKCLTLRLDEPGLA